MVMRMRPPSIAAITKHIFWKVISALLVGVLIAIATLPFYSSIAKASSPQTFYAHSENRGYEASDNKMDQATPEPASATYVLTPASAGDYQTPANNASGGRYFTAGWPSAGTIAAGTWTFHAWIKKGGGSSSYYVKVFKNAEASPQFTSSSVAISNSWAEIDVTGSAPAISMSAGDRLRFEYWVNVTSTSDSVTLYPTSNHVVAGSVSSPTEVYTQNDVGALVSSNNTEFHTAVFDDGTDRGTITSATVYVRYKTTAAPSNDTYLFDAALDGTNFNTSIVAPTTTNQSTYVTASASLGTPTWTQIGTLEVRSKTAKVAGPDGYNVDWDVAYVVINFTPSISLRIDDNSTPDTSTRVDTTVAQLVPTLGYFLLTLGVLLFIFVAIKRRILVVHRGNLT